MRDLRTKTTRNLSKAPEKIDAYGGPSVTFARAVETLSAYVLLRFDTQDTPVCGVAAF